MSNAPSNSKLPAHESFWTIAFRVQYLAFCREVDKDNPNIYAETLARLHIVDGKQREPDEGSKLSRLPLAETGKAQRGALPPSSVGKERPQSPAPASSLEETRLKREVTKGSKLDLKPAAEYYKVEAADKLQVEAKKDQPGVSSHADKKDGSCASQLLPLQVNGKKEPIIKSGRLDLKASAEYHKDLRTEQKSSQDVEDSQELQSPSKSAEEQWTNYFKGNLTIQEAENIFRRRNLKGRRKRKAINLAVYERCGFRFSELQNFFKFEFVRYLLHTVSVVIADHIGSITVCRWTYMTAITSISCIFGRDTTKTIQLRLRSHSESRKIAENVSLSNQVPHFHCLISGSETDDYLLPIAPNRRHKKDYNQYQRDLAAKAKDQCQNKSAKSTNTTTKAKDQY
jgi:hypothetical protein